jgi:hypothetical protein
MALLVLVTALVARVVARRCRAALAAVLGLYCDERRKDRETLASALAAYRGERGKDRDHEGHLELERARRRDRVIAYASLCAVAEDLLVASGLTRPSVDAIGRDRSAAMEAWSGVLRQSRLVGSHSVVAAAEAVAALCDRAIRRYDAALNEMLRDGDGVPRIVDFDQLEEMISNSSGGLDGDGPTEGDEALAALIAACRRDLGEPTLTAAPE